MKLYRKNYYYAYLYLILFIINENNEKVNQVIINIGDKIVFNITENNLATVHRISLNIKNIPRMIIIVRFLSRLSKISSLLPIKDSVTS